MSTSPYPSTLLQALNEGRSLNSGDTHSAIRAVLAPYVAQRRSESELRRHAPGCPERMEAGDRSTKAGV